MDAEEARKITNQNLDGIIIEPLLKIAYKRIKKFAEQGKSSVPHPFHGAPFHLLGKTFTVAAIHQLRSKGYRATYHQNPDPEDQRSQSYWEISW